VRAKELADLMADDLEKLRREFDQLRRQFHGFVTHVNVDLKPLLGLLQERVGVLERSPKPATPSGSPEKG